jgi:hypothetical protein
MWSEGEGRLKKASVKGMKDKEEEEEEEGPFLLLLG